MRQDTESMPLLAYDQLGVIKPIEDEVRVECYDDAMTGEMKIQFIFQIPSLPLVLVRSGCRSTW